MPTYEYRCNACRREFEVQQKINDAELVTCEACGKNALERLISWTSVRSDTWQAALFTDNPREAMRGTHAVDRSTTRERFRGNDDAPHADDTAVAPTPADADAKTGGESSS